MDAAAPLISGVMLCDVTALPINYTGPSQTRTLLSLLSEWFALYIFGVLADSAYCCVRPCAWLHVDELEAVVLKVQRINGFRKWCSQTCQANQSLQS